MESYKYRCPFCDTDITSHHFYEHLARKHEAEIYGSKSLTNYQRLPKSISQPLKIILETKIGPPEYFVCLGCSRCCKKKASTERHFDNPSCKEKHNKKIKELLEKYKNPLETKEEIPIAPIIQGYTEEQVFALIGSMMEWAKNCQRDEKEAKNKADYYQEKLLDAGAENQDDESIPEFYPDDDDIDFYQPEDMTALNNIAEKMGLRISNSKVEEAYKKWHNMPIKKRKPKVVDGV